jgi:Xaa-Pro aminopeptidase
MTRTRLEKVRTALGSLDALLVTSLPNIRYLTGFTGSNALVIVTRTRKFLLTDSRYRQQSAVEAGGWRRIIDSRGLFDSADHAGCLKGCRRVGFDSATVTYDDYRRLRTTFRKVRFEPTRGLVETQAMSKDRTELLALRKAMRITDRVFEDLLGSLRPGTREREIAAEITYRQRAAGADGDAFEPIVASGPRSALPHARAGDRRVGRGEPLVLDFGCRVGGYHSDLTRTVCFGKAPRQLKTLFEVVRCAHDAAIEAVEAGMPARELDARARRIIAAAGFGKQFIHSLGHGLGLHVHERPRISAVSAETIPLDAVITIEPGIYLPGYGGVRIEDDVLVTRTGGRVLTHAPIALEL